MSLANRWCTEKSQEVNIARKDQHDPRGARVFSFTAREETPGYEIASHAPKRFEIHQGDVDPAMGGSAGRRIGRNAHGQDASAGTQRRFAAFGSLLKQDRG